MPVNLVKSWFTALHFSVFGKDKELVGDIKYAFGSQVLSTTPEMWQLKCLGPWFWFGQPRLGPIATGPKGIQESLPFLV